MTCDLYTGWSHNGFLRHDRRRWLTLAAVLVCLSVDHLFDVAAVEQAWGVVVEGLERLAGAVGLLGGNAAVLAFAGWARVAALFLSPALVQWAVRPAFFHIPSCPHDAVKHNAATNGALARLKFRPSVSLLLSTWRAKEGAHRDWKREGGRKWRELIKKSIN